MTAERAYFSALNWKATGDYGSPLRLGTTVVPEADRAGTMSATSYPIPGRMIIWADPDLVDRLGDLNGPNLITTRQFIAHAESIGGSLVGVGNNRVLEVEDDALVKPTGADTTGVTFRRLDRDSDADRGMLAAFVAACDDDDVEEADLDLEELDPVITAFVTDDGVIASYASARPSSIDDAFDDIGVLTHPDSRGRKLGALAVYEFVKKRRPKTRRFLYRCNYDNEASNELAESLGFTLAHRIGAVTFA